MKIRNIAIIAHVDHGKTTLIDQLLKQSGIFRDNQKVEERIMDSNELERERGITIFAKITSIQKNNLKYNIVDTPGHADFGGEVERILSMVDGVILLVDSAEGPMPQTKFVTSKALNLGICPIVVLNKLDKRNSEPNRVLDEVFDLFVSLGASDKQLDFPILYASGRDGWAVKDLNDKKIDLLPMLDLIKNHVCEPVQVKKINEKFKLLVTTIRSDKFLGRIVTGRVEGGTIKNGDTIKAIDIENKVIETFKVTKLFIFSGIEQKEVSQVFSGDIISIAGANKATVSNTLVDISLKHSLKTIPIDPPTITIGFSVNDSPLSGKEGSKLQSRVIRERLLKEVEGNIAIKINIDEKNDFFEVSGRGELQLSILIENMRREGFELTIARPKVIQKKIKNVINEPFEEVTIDIDEEFSGIVIEKLNIRKGEILEIKKYNNRSRIIAIIPSRGLIGYFGEFLTDTKGSGIMNRIFFEWRPKIGNITQRRRGVLISMENGISVAYALFNLEDRGKFFISSGESVYCGMIIGEHNKEGDLEVNPMKGKKLTNIRASGNDESIRLTTPHRLTLEQAISYINDDELVEVTPLSIRLRKKILNSVERKRKKE